MGVCCTRQEISDVDNIEGWTSLQLHLKSTKEQITKELKQLGSFRKNSNHEKETFKVNIF
jgi:hypothetical protein